MFHRHMVHPYGPYGPQIQPAGYPIWYFWLHLMGDLLILALIVVGVVLLIKALSHRPPHAVHQSPVLAELEMRYARGEISREEFLQRRADLTGVAMPPAPVAPSPPPSPS